jgi:hypothetical protein
MHLTMSLTVVLSQYGLRDHGYFFLGANVLWWPFCFYNVKVFNEKLFCPCTSPHLFFCCPHIASENMTISPLQLMPYSKGHYSRSSHAHFSHIFYVAWRFPRTLHIFFVTHLLGDVSQYRSQKFVRTQKKMCQSGPPHIKKIAPSHKKSTEWSEWQEWYVLNSYEHKHCAHLRTRPVHNLNSIWDTFVYQYWIPILNYNSLMMPLFSQKNIFAQKLLIIYFLNTFEFVHE